MSVGTDYDDIVLPPPVPLFDLEDFDGPEHLALVAEYKRQIVAYLARAYGIGRNDPCVCRSGRKLKKCCGAAA